MATAPLALAPPPDAAVVAVAPAVVGVGPYSPPESAAVVVVAAALVVAVAALVVAVAASVVAVAASVVADAAAVVADAAAVVADELSSSSPQAAAPIRRTTLARPTTVRDDVSFTRGLR
jgi:hypothetical protein